MKPKRLGGAAGGEIEGVAFPFEAAVAEIFKDVAGEEVEGFGGGGGALEGWRKEDVADFDDSVRGVEAHEAGVAFGLWLLSGEDGEETGCGAGFFGGQGFREIVFAGVGALG